MYRIYTLSLFSAINSKITVHYSSILFPRKQSGALRDSFFLGQKVESSCPSLALKIPSKPSIEKSTLIHLEIHFNKASASCWLFMKSFAAAPSRIQLYQNGYPKSPGSLLSLWTVVWWLDTSAVQSSTLLIISI